MDDTHAVIARAQWALIAALMAGGTALDSGADGREVAEDLLDRIGGVLAGLLDSRVTRGSGGSVTITPDHGDQP